VEVEFSPVSPVEVERDVEEELLELLLVAVKFPVVEFPSSMSRLSSSNSSSSAYKF